MSTIKVDTVRPVTTDGSLTLQGDSSGSGVSGITIDSSGNTTLGGNLVIPNSGTIGSVGDTDAITIDSSGNTTATLSSSSNIKAPLNASGSAPVYACRAWVNFYGGPSTPYIRASGNVSNITDSGVGKYTVNFTTAMPNVNYAVGGLVQPSVSNAGSDTFSDFTFNTTTSVRITHFEDGTLRDSAFVSVIVFR
jgi:hypothetical protein